MAVYVDRRIALNKEMANILKDDGGVNFHNIKRVQAKTKSAFQELK